MAGLAGKSFPELASDARARGIGERLFVNNCAACHDSDARGSLGFPNLSDGEWVWGGPPEDIVASITNGREGNMPPMAAAVGTPEDVKNVANYVLSLSGSPSDSVGASQGKAKFAACAACHGPEGKGMAAVGAPNLTDGVWLHGWGEEAIVRAVNNGFNNHMPPQAALLNEARPITSGSGGAERGGVQVGDAYVPLNFELGKAFQFDWSEEPLVIGGQYQRLQVSHMKLCASRAFWLVAYPPRPRDAGRCPHPLVRSAGRRGAPGHLRQHEDGRGPRGQGQDA